MHQFDRQPIEQFGMRRPGPLRAKIAGRGHDSPAEMMLPEAVDDHPGEQRPGPVIDVGNPIGQRVAAEKSSGRRQAGRSASGRRRRDAATGRSEIPARLRPLSGSGRPVSPETSSRKSRALAYAIARRGPPRWRSASSPVAASERHAHAPESLAFSSCHRRYRSVCTNSAPPACSAGSSVLTEPVPKLQQPGSHVGTDAAGRQARPAAARW